MTEQRKNQHVMAESARKAGQRVFETETPKNSNGIHLAQCRYGSISLGPCLTLSNLVCSATCLINLS